MICCKCKKEFDIFAGKYMNQDICKDCAIAFLSNEIDNHVYKILSDDEVYFGDELKVERYKKDLDRLNSFHSSPKALEVGAALMRFWHDFSDEDFDEIMSFINKKSEV